MSTLPSVVLLINKFSALVCVALSYLMSPLPDGATIAVVSILYNPSSETKEPPSPSIASGTACDPSERMKVSSVGTPDICILLKGIGDRNVISASGTSTKSPSKIFQYFWLSPVPSTDTDSV